MKAPLRARLWAVVAVATVVVASCSNGAEVVTSDVGITSPAVTLTMTPEEVPAPPSTTPAHLLPQTPEEAWSTLLDDPNLTADEVRAAGLLVGGHHPSLPFPELYAAGDAAMRRAIEEVLALPSAWNSQLLVALTLPEMDFDDSLLAVRDEALSERFGESADLARRLIWNFIVGQSEVVEATPWFDVPEAVSAIEGVQTANTFSGAVKIVSDTGEGHEITVRARRHQHGWDVVDGSWLEAVEGYPPFEPVERGAALTIEDLGTLPAEGIAVSVAGDVVLLTPDGSVLGHLPFFTFGWTFGLDLPLLEDPEGATFDLGGAPVDGLPLAAGAVLQWAADAWTITTGAGEIVELTKAFRVDSSGRVVTFEWFEGGTAYDVAAGVTVEIPPRCWVADAGRSDWVLSCDHDDDPPTLQTLSGGAVVGEEQWQAVYEDAGWPWPSPVIGHIARLVPVGERWLARWSGECESEDAFVISPGSIDHVTGLDWESAASASAGGWMSDGRMVFSQYGFGFGCESAAETPGVYTAIPGDTPELLWDSGGRTVGVMVWGS